ncbi:ribonuclease domain-containing protein [Hamadaea tsunoensis]|uniref:ribonuclease domain-containing protein n=1 Tax=Hamadaea tsunoensis TaxID=53368 RepID=UPI0003FD5F2D|nr:ribonuclease domain-containing protein [Hamadaea tsunoensis]
MANRTRQQLMILAAAGAVVIVVLATLLGLYAGSRHAASPASSPSVAASTSAGAATPVSGLRTVRETELPAEARQTLALIDKGGPYPYSRDGIVFSNNEKLLPQRPRGYYHEYTVVTPGSKDRGARRLITGTAGDIYYTDDHYASFRQVVRG